jgi:hypothetical protein
MFESLLLHFPLKVNKIALNIGRFCQVIFVCFHSIQGLVHVMLHKTSFGAVYVWRRVVFMRQNVN